MVFGLVSVETNICKPVRSHQAKDHSVCTYFLQIFYFNTLLAETCSNG